MIKINNKRTNIGIVRESFALTCMLEKNYLFNLLLVVALAVMPTDSEARTQIDTSTAAPESAPCNTVEIFFSQSCPHCARALQFLEQLESTYPEISVSALDINASSEALSRFFHLNEQHHIDRPGVPAFLVCGEFIIGFDEADTTGIEIRQLLGVNEKNSPAVDQNQVNVPLIGYVSLESLGLPLFTIIIGLVDGFNPCAMWVLLFLLSMLVNLRDRARILLIAGTFVLVSGMVYFTFMAAWLNLFLVIGFSRWIQLTVATIALIVGGIHIKDFFSFRQGLSLSIPDTAKPGLYARMRRVIQAENLPAAMVGIFVIAVLVNFLELLCTAGLPALYTQILTSKTLSYTAYYGYLLLYNLAYIFDDALMVGIVVYSLHRYKIQERQGRWLKLLSGGLIFVLGILLILAPDVLF